MTDKKKYNQLDDVRIVGTQEKKSALSQKNHERKTGDIFRKARAASSTAHKVKKAS
jgi:hypothetical protein